MKNKLMNCPFCEQCKINDTVRKYIMNITKCQLPDDYIVDMCKFAREYNIYTKRGALIFSCHGIYDYIIKKNKELIINEILK